MEFSSMSSSSGDDQNLNQEEFSEADLAQALRELHKGERTAQALEANLTSLEKKIDDLLASFDSTELEKLEQANTKTSAEDQQASKESGSSGSAGQS